MTFTALLLWTIAQAPPAHAAAADAAERAFLTSTNWRTHPRVVAVRTAVHEIDARTGTTSTTRRCHTLREANGHVLAETIDETTTRMSDPGRSVKTSARHRLREEGNADVNADGDLHVVFYTRNGAPLFLYVNGVHRGQGFFKHEVRVYFDDAGAPFWSVVVTDGAASPGQPTIEARPGFADDSRGDGSSTSLPYTEIIPMLARWRTATARDVFSACKADG